VNLDLGSSVKSYQKISAPAVGLTDTTNGGADLFGSSVAYLGDLDGDTVPDVCVGARASVNVLFLNSDATVKAHSRISNIIDRDSNFGISMSPLSDLNGKGMTACPQYRCRTDTANLHFV
jgi:hypothetical protein